MKGPWVFAWKYMLKYSMDCLLHNRYNLQINQVKHQTKSKHKVASRLTDCLLLKCGVNISIKFYPKADTDWSKFLLPQLPDISSSSMFTKKPSSSLENYT